jgi:hyperosmotically inducible protein
MRVQWHCVVAAFVQAALFLILLVPATVLSQANSGEIRAGGRYDQQIQQEVSSELRKHDWAKDVRSSVEDGIVTLQGTVRRFLDKERAYDKVRNKDHVQGVRNQIVVAGPAVPDPVLRSQIVERLRYDRIDQGITFNNFSVSVKNGVVTLGGEARTPVDAESARAIVENTPGVKDVIDEIKILPTSITDDETRIAVARAIYGNPSLQKYAIDPQRPIRIIVQNGRVTLYGVVDSTIDKQMAEMQAKSVPNVFQVDDRLIVAGQQPQ